MKKLILFICLFLSLISQQTFCDPDPDPEFLDYPILNEERLELTQAYAKKFYNVDSYILHDPVMIVIHYTAIGSLGATLSSFKPTKMSMEREKLYMHSKLNVGVHFVIDTNGEIYKLLPTTIMGRHAIGYNHLSIGIENVAATDVNLTRAQIRANAKLISILIKQHPSITYLIGHHEYMTRFLPHFKLYTQLDPTYEPTIKIDPGFGFMDSLRNILKNEYGIVLLD